MSSEPYFQGHIGRYTSESTPWWPEPPKPAPGSPNVVFIMLDDVGFGHLGCYGSSIDTPSMDRLAANGIRYRNFHTTTICSPSRACLLTGRNHHSVGMRTISNYDTGFPSARGAISPSAATIAQMLQQTGYNTAAFGKWHLAPMADGSAVGPFTGWPLQKGFERYYGFLDALTDQFAPELILDNRHIPSPSDPDYHLSEAIVDEAIEFVRDQTSLSTTPFFLYVAFGACHSPHQAPPEYLDKYRGKFDEGWDATREAWFQRQLELGIVPEGTQLAPRNNGVPAWDDLSEDEQRVRARLQEAFAAMLDHMDHQIGRLADYLEEVDELDNTLFVVVSDNGASQEGGPLGVVNEGRFYNQVPASEEYNQANIDEIGGPRSHTNYPWGWAQVGNTPLKRYKQNTHGGGIRDPLIIHWPDRIKDAGAIRPQFHHISDIVPTVLEVLGVEAPEMYQGVPQLPIHGTSMLYTFDSGDEPTRKRNQHFEMFGHRGIWHDGWKAVTFHAPGGSFEDDQWELYHLDEDFSECNDLAESEPEKLKEMIEHWWIEAAKYDVLPLEDGLRGARGTPPKKGSPQDRTSFVYRQGMAHTPTNAAADVRNRDYTITVELTRETEADEGVLIAHGGITGGYSLFIKDNRLVHEYSYVGERYRIVSDTDVPIGGSVVTFEFTKTNELAGTAILTMNGRQVGSGDLPATLGGMFAIEGLDVGQDLYTPVSEDYEVPFAFSGAIAEVRIELGSNQVLDREAELRGRIIAE
ncbi:MAG: arylsulfatase [Chloroflexi bacterium]|nr:arylsulfatase [Chloroflexota bacterium]